MNLSFRIAMLVFLALASAAFAQSYPDYANIAVNDQAGILDPDTKATLSAQLDQLRADTGIEMTVLTLKRQALYAPDSTLEAFARGLFDHWGIGNKTSNDGILVLVLRQDRTMRIELGAAYGRDWDRAAKEVVERSFLPAFKTYNYSAGITNGVSDLINAVALPFHQGAGAAAAPGGNGPLIGLAFLGGIAAFIGSIFFLPTLATALRACPKCGKRGFHGSTEILLAATETSTGEGRKTMSCAHCGHKAVSLFVLPLLSRTSKDSSGSSGGSSDFGGGSSGGGGASGKW